MLLTLFLFQDTKVLCPACMETGQQRFLKYLYVNINEAVYKCESSTCLYPFRDFKYKNYADRTIFRYERISETDEKTSDQKIFPSPTKIESDDMDHFNLNWLDNSFTDDLDSILTTPSEGKTCDIKEIMNSICSNARTTSTSFNSPSKMESELLTTAPVPKLSKCLQYIEDLSPTKLSHSNIVETITPTRRNSDECASTQATTSKKKVSVWTPGSKSKKKIRNGFKKNQEIKPVQKIIVEQQQQLGFLDWLDTVSKIDSEQIQEFEFASPTQLMESSQINLTNNTLNPSDLTQPVIELTSSSYVLDGNQLSSNSEPCLSYQLNLNKFQTTESHCETTSNVQHDDPMTTQTLEHILLGDETLVDSAALNVENSTCAGGESFSPAFQIIKTKYGAGSNRSHQDHVLINGVQTKRSKAKPKREINPDDVKLKKENDKVKRKMKRKLKQEETMKMKQEETKRMKEEETKKRKQMETVKVNEKSLNIEVEEDFHGFETLEPFTPFILQRKPLVWLKIE